MKLADHVEYIRQLIDTTVRNRLGRMGVTGSALQSIDSIPEVYRSERKRIEPIREVLIAETGTVTDAYEKMVEEFTFTLFNRIAALKVIEAHTLHPEIITRRSQHGDRSFSHKHWLEQNPEGRKKEMEGIVHFIEDSFAAFGSEIPLFSPAHPYHLLPTAFELNAIINAFNVVETDEQVKDEIWESDDVLGWLYESYNFHKKKNHDESGLKTEYDKVSIQSQYYTPRWVVKFLIDNSLGKLYLEMYPESDIKNRYKIANSPKTQTRTPIPLTEIKLIDPATGSGNFLLYGFDLFYDLYIDQIENYGSDYIESKIPELIIANNLHGIDLDDRAVQLAQLGLYIKAKRKKRTAKIDHFNVVSSDFFLPDYEQVQPIFEENSNLDSKEKEIIHDIWSDLQQAYKFGSLIRLEEKLSIRLHGIAQSTKSLFSDLEASNYEQFRDNFFINLQKAISLNTAKQGLTFLNTKTQDAITFLQLLTQKYDVSVANPPYTDSADFGIELKFFIDSNYKEPYKFNSNLYSAFIKRCSELIDNRGKIALIHPLTFMFIKTFEDVREFILKNFHINVIIDYGLSNQVFGGPAVNPAIYVLEKELVDYSVFIKLNDLPEGKRPEALIKAFNDLLENRLNQNIYKISQEKLKIIDGWPFIYWISDGFRKKFKAQILDEVAAIRAGIQTSNNERFLRFWWEVKPNEISENYNVDKKKWVKYAKGGPFNRWDGNIWLIIDWERNGQKIQEFLDTKKLDLHAQPYYFLEGLTYSPSGSKGASFRYLPVNHLFDIGGASVFLIYQFKNLNYLAGLLNSNLSAYIVNCLNPTINVQPVDLKRIPFVDPPVHLEENISVLTACKSSA